MLMQKQNVEFRFSANSSLLRRAYGAGLAGLGALLLCCAYPSASAQRAERQGVRQNAEIELRLVDQARQLPDYLFGANVEAEYFEHLGDNPEKFNAAKDLNLKYVRFPGGSFSNFYHWQTGTIDCPSFPNSSEYVKYWTELSSKMNHKHPEGSKIENYWNSAKAIGAKISIIPNLETASVADQVAWFKQMKQHSCVPDHIELGNEYYLYMGGDPNSLKRWPDEASSMKIMKQYADAFRPYLPAHSEIAVQAAGASFQTDPNSKGKYHQHWIQWDEALKPEPWFDAVILHLYPRLNMLLSPKAPKGMELYQVLMAHCDEGVDRVVSDIERRMPAKEIWITEWNAHGEQMRNGESPVTPGMEMQANTRMALAFLRHKQLGTALYFSLDYQGRLFNKIAGGKYQPTPTAVALEWLYDAANGGSIYQRVADNGAQPIEGGDWGYGLEQYNEIEGALFSKGKRRVLLIQNPSGQRKHFNPEEFVKNSMPSSIETASTPDILSQDNSAPELRQEKLGSAGVILPPYSVCRIIWQ